MISRAKRLGIKNALAWYTVDKKRTAYKIKAAAKIYIIDSLKTLLYAQDKMQKAGTTETEEFKKIVIKMEFILSLIKDHSIFSDIEIDKDAKNQDIEKGKYTLYHEKNKSVINKPKTNTGCTSKRRGLSKLGEGWQEKVSKLMDYEPLIDLFISTGVRPSEVAETKIYAVDKGLMVVIQGKKTGEDNAHGQKERRILIDAKDKAAQRLINAGIFSFGEYDLKKIDSISQKMGHITKAIYGVRVSAYTFRHGFAEVQKSSGMSAEDLARCLGHSVTQTQKAYGKVSKNSIGKKSSVLSVSAEKDIKTTGKSWSRDDSQGPEVTPGVGPSLTM
jgi:integrase